MWKSVMKGEREWRAILDLTAHREVSELRARVQEVEGQRERLLAMSRRGDRVRDTLLAELDAYRAKETNRHMHLTAGVWEGRTT